METPFPTWLYQNDFNNTARYVLGTEGGNPLVCFGINPSTAEPGNLDNTLKSVSRLAKNNDFDSWVMLNIYPQRATYPNDIHRKMDKKLHQRNLEEIEKLLSQNTQTTIWAGWGTLIEKRDYFRNCLMDIYNLTKNYPCSWVSIGKPTKMGHPHHPLYLRNNSKTQDFDMDNYIQQWKNS